MEFMEKRSEKRVPSKFLISLKTQDNPDIIVRVLSFNISAIGICFQSDLVLRVNERVELELPTSLGKLKLQAVIIWNRMNEYGCHFVDMEATAQRTLKQWLFPPFEP